MDTLRLIEAIAVIVAGLAVIAYVGLVVSRARHQRLRHKARYHLISFYEEELQRRDITEERAKVCRDRLEWLRELRL